MATTEDRSRSLAADHLVDALDAETRPEKEFRIREALQLLSIEER